MHAVPDTKPQTSNPINPKFSFRFSIEEIRASYGSLEAAFDAGAYLLVAEYAEQGSELEGCALVLGGFLQRGLQLLIAIATLTDRGLICRAYAEWALGRPEAARTTLTMVPEDSSSANQAGALRELVDKPQVTVFTTAVFLPLPSITGKSAIAAEPMHRYGQFLVKNVATQLATNAYDFEPHQSLDEFIARLPNTEQPDFVLALTPAWIPPKDFEKVTVPKVLWCHDTDVFLYRGWNNIALYDVRIVNTSQEQFELNSILGQFCVSNLTLDPFSREFPTAQLNPQKDIDVIFTGQALSIYHPEKSRFIYQMAALGDDYKVAVFDEYVPEGDYLRLLSRSKFLPIVNRYAGCPSPRWRDALVNSVHVLHPRGTAFGKAFPGCFAFDSSSLADDMRAHIENYNAHVDGYDPHSTYAEMNARLSEFRQPHEIRFEQLLKFAAFSALVMRPRTQRPPQAIQRQLVWLTSCIDPAIYGRDNIRAKISSLVDASSDEALTDEPSINNRAHLYAQLALIFPEAPEAAEWRIRADNLLADGCRRHPTSLVLRFNRAHWAFFSLPNKRDKAARLFRRFLDQWDTYQFNPIGADVGLSYTIPGQEKIFPYYEYAQEVISRAAEHGRRGASANIADTDLRNMIKGAAYGYLGWEALERNSEEEGLAYLDKGLGLYPQNLWLTLFRLDALLSRAQRLSDPPKTLTNATCDTFLSCANQFPTVLLTHTHRVCAWFRHAGRHEELRHVLDSWYRMGNVINTANPEERYKREIAGFAEIWNFAEYLPERLHAKLDLHSDGVGLTQFQNLVLSGAKLHRKPVESRDARAPATETQERPLLDASALPPQGSEARTASSVETSVHAFDHAQQKDDEPPDIRAFYREQQRDVAPPDYLARIHELEGELAAIRNSTSWRVTAPGRRLAAKLRHFFRRLAKVL